MDQWRDYYQASLVLSRNTFKFLQGVFEPALRSRNVKTPTNTPTHPGPRLSAPLVIPWRSLIASPGQDSRTSFRYRQGRHPPLMLLGAPRVSFCEQRSRQDALRCYKPALRSLWGWCGTLSVYINLSDFFVKNRTGPLAITKGPA